MSEKYILLVEDNRWDEELILRALEINRIANKVVVAHDGAEALEYMFGTGAYDGRDVMDLPTVILMDIKLPKIDGLEVLRRIRADVRTRLVPVAILTSSKEEKDRVVGYAAGANSFVRKPIEFAEFAQAVGVMGLYWLVLNEPPPPVEK
ncbi:MAG: response regulator [Gammaproteobacteria bacterium]|nr:response regulator [Gammaproteobacteria bacterium]